MHNKQKATKTPKDKKSMARPKLSPTKPKSLSPRVGKAKSKLDMGQIPKVGRAVAVRKVRGHDYSVMPPTAMDYFYLIDGIAAEVWGMIDGKKNWSKIVSAIQESHTSVPEAQLLADIEKFVQELNQLGLINT